MSITEKVIGRKFDTTEYGVCFIEDALDDIPESVVKVSFFATQTLILLVFKLQHSSVS